ncbi:MAG: hypothetical protein RSA91_07795, partial [Bacilli bacterium]
MKYLFILINITYVLDCLAIILLIIKEIINKHLTRLIPNLQTCLLEVILLYIKNLFCTILAVKK